MVSDLNQAASEVADLNGRIRSTLAAGGVGQRADGPARPPDHEDRESRRGVSSARSTDGTVDVLVGGNALVNGTTANARAGRRHPPPRRCDRRSGAPRVGRQARSGHRDGGRVDLRRPFHAGPGRRLRNRWRAGGSGRELQRVRRDARPAGQRRAPHRIDARAAPPDWTSSRSTPPSPPRSVSPLYRRRSIRSRPEPPALVERTAASPTRSRSSAPARTPSTSSGQRSSSVSA